MGQERATLGRDLAHALRTGPFSAALHLAIEDRGVRLEEIQRQLAAAGVNLSVTTLSYWRRGRSRPERPESLKAVRLLERILALPEESLMAQLGPRRPRGRWLTRPPGTIEVDRLFSDGVSVARAIGALDRWLYHELTRLSLHDLYTVTSGSFILTVLSGYAAHKSAPMIRFISIEISSFTGISPLITASLNMP